MTTVGGVDACTPVLIDDHDDVEWPGPVHDEHTGLTPVSPELRPSALSSDSVASIHCNWRRGMTAALVDVLSSRIASAVHATRLNGSRHTGHVV